MELTSQQKANLTEELKSCRNRIDAALLALHAGLDGVVATIVEDFVEAAIDLANRYFSEDRCCPDRTTTELCCEDE